MTPFLWPGITFLISIFVLIYSSNLFLSKAEKVGAALGIPSFLIGVLVVGVGTSLPELVSALSAILKDTTEIVVANAAGSNITNILFVVGIVAIFGKKLVINKNLLDSELPFFITSTVLFIGVAFDGIVTVLEAGMLFSMYAIYLIYLSTTDRDADTMVIEKGKKIEIQKSKEPEINKEIIITLLVALGGVLFSAHFLIASTINIAEILGVTPAIISLSAIAFGTSLPELSVSLSALKAGKTEVAIGNIFGSSALNILLAVGLPALITPLYVEAKTISFAIPTLAAVTFIFFVIGMAKKIYRWEGLMFLVVYAFFIAKIFGL